MAIARYGPKTRTHRLGVHLSDGERDGEAVLNGRRPGGEAESTVHAAPIWTSG